MARPATGRPPVATSAVAVREPAADRRDMIVYRDVASKLRRADRWADLVSMLGSRDLAERFISVALHAISNNSDLLLNAEPMTIIQAVKDSAALGLEPTGLGGEGWIIRYGKVATFQPGYRGYLKRIRNSGLVSFVDCQVVYEADVFEYGWSEQGAWFRHRPNARELFDADGNTRGRGNYWGAYAYATMPSGYCYLEPMPFAEIEHIRRTYSKAGADGKLTPWDTHWGEMARKTAIRKLAKRLPQSAVDRLLAADEAIEQQIAEENDRPRLDVSAVRARAIAAAGGEAPTAALGPGEPPPGPTPAQQPVEEEPAKEVEVGAAIPDDEPPPPDPPFI